MKELKSFNGFTLEKRMQELLQSKSHKFDTGVNNICIKFEKSEDGEVTNVSIFKNNLIEKIMNIIKKNSKEHSAYDDIHIELLTEIDKLKDNKK